MSEREPALELQLDGLVGPTHHHGGRSPGNLASTTHRGDASNPRAAALQGLEKMERVAGLGVPQAVLPPQERPDLVALRRLGFGGADREVLAAAARRDPGLLSACASASSMWAANAATVSPAADTADGRVHLTPANLVAHLHRSLEAAPTARALAAIFADDRHFVVHEPLPASAGLADEGAANHLRLAGVDGGAGLELFVYGRDPGEAGAPRPRRHPARQSRRAGEAIARLHGLDPARTRHLRQHPDAIDAGAFHDDVVAVAHDRFLLHHARAFAEPLALDPEGEGTARAVGDDELTLDEAVSTYLFNSQIVTATDGTVVMLAPEESRTHERARALLARLAAEPGVPIDHVDWVDTRQSMRNGGGPACLRLGVLLDPAALDALHRGVRLDATLGERLRAWIEAHFRDRLWPADLADPDLLDESRRALDELTQLLALGALYPFQRSGA